MSETLRRFLLNQSGQLVELDGHGALLASGVVLVQQTVSDSLVDGLDSHLVRAIGLAAVAFRHRGVKLLQVRLQLGPLSLVLRSLGLIHQDTLLGRLDIRQTKHLLRLAVFWADSTRADMYFNIRISKKQLLF